MKLNVVKLLFCFFFFGICSLSASAQNLTGIWQGYFITESMDQYKVELQIEQNKNNRISGVSYSYLSTVFYGKASLTGFYNKTGKTALVQEIKTLELRMSGGSVACIMKCLFNYARSGNEEFLEGTFTSMYEKTDSAYGIKRGGNCGGGKIYLRKVATSDFYVEPFLREKPTKPNNNIAKNNTPKPKPPTVTHKPTTPSKPVTKKPELKKTEEHNTHISPPVITQEMPKTELPKPAPQPAIIRNRTNDLLQTVNVTSDEVTIKIYDNGEIDDDTVSVYLDNKLILANKRLSTTPITYTFKITDDEPEHIITMVAENLGRIPPNTSLMMVHSGDKRYEVRISTNEQKNAVIRFRYQKPE